MPYVFGHVYIGIRERPVTVHIIIQEISGAVVNTVPVLVVPQSDHEISSVNVSLRAVLRNVFHEGDPRPDISDVSGHDLLIPVYVHSVKRVGEHDRIDVRVFAVKAYLYVACHRLELICIQHLVDLTVPVNVSALIILYGICQGVNIIGIDKPVRYA